MTEIMATSGDRKCTVKMFNTSKGAVFFYSKIKALSCIDFAIVFLKYTGLYCYDLIRSCC